MNIYQFFTNLYLYFTPQALAIAAYGFIVLGYYVAYFSSRTWVYVTLGFVLVLGYASYHIDHIGIAVVLAIAYLAFTLQAYMSKLSQIFIWILLVGLCVATYQHFIPGFYNWLVVDGVQISSNTKPFTMYLNFDKGIVGLILFAVLASRIEVGTLIHKLQEATAIIIITMLLLISVSFWMGYVRYDLKAPSFTALWLLTNFFFVCIPEEALFRGLMIKHLTTWFGKYAALIISTIAFVGLHWSAGINFMILAGIAGLLYGWTYIKYNSIEVPIISHFIVNSTHFFVFSYPALA